MNSKTENNLNNEQKANVRHWPKTFDQAVKVAASHVARYGFAEKYATDKKVCDIGSNNKNIKDLKSRLKLRQEYLRQIAKFKK